MIWITVIKTFVINVIFAGDCEMNFDYQEDSTIPHVTRNDGIKTTLYAVVGISIAIFLIVGTILLFIPNRSSAVCRCAAPLVAVNCISSLHRVLRPVGYYHMALKLR